ncbi:MAG: FliM/FliN family flagellar motor switch protein, partial [Planctomycetota bacterium]
MADEQQTPSNVPNETRAAAPPPPDPTDIGDAAQVAAQALEAAQGAVDSLQDTASAVPMPDFEAIQADIEATGIDMLGDVELEVKIELGRTHMLVEDVLRLTEGSVIELDKLAGDPVDIFVNSRLVARGEVLV